MVKENAAQLIKLIAENPTLPIVHMVNAKIASTNGHSDCSIRSNILRFIGVIGRCYVGEYFVDDHNIIRIKDSFENNIYDLLYLQLPHYFVDSLSDDEARDKFDKLPWIKAIIIEID